MEIIKEFLIENSKTILWDILNSNSDFDISFKETQKILEKFLGRKVNLVILNIDLIGSTKISLNLPMDKLTIVIRSFAQEMYTIITNFGGFVLKFVGDAVLAFFIFEDKIVKHTEMNKEIENDDGNNDISSYMYNHVIECAKTMIEIIQRAVNPVLSESGLPKLRVRVGMDFGEVAFVKYGMDIDRIDEKTTIKRMHIDMIGYTISLAVKMTSFARPDHIIIGESLFNRLDKKKRKEFEQQPIKHEFWKYIKETTGKDYRLYQN